MTKNEQCPWGDRRSVSSCDSPNSCVVVGPFWTGYISESLEKNMCFQVGNSEDKKNCVAKRCLWPNKMVY